MRFEALVNAMSANLYRYAFWLCRDRTMAEDLVQETFLRAWKSLASLRDEKAAKRWLITILRREFARQFERRRPELTDVDLDDLAGDRRDNNAEVVLLRHALASLAEKYRDPLLLQVLGGFNCAEIADLLGLSSGAVMTRLFRARRKLREALEGDAATRFEDKVVS